MKRPFIGLLVLGLLIVGIFGYWTLGNQAANPTDKSEKVFVISQGANVRQIGNNLKDEGLIRDPVVFFVYLKLKGLDRNIQAGDYKLSPSMTLEKIVENLNHGTIDLWVTIPEGMRADEIADILHEKVPTYDESWRASLDENEGYLFPDTYLIPVDAKVDTVISIMRNNFSKKIAGIGLSDNSPNLNNIVTLASLIEREAITDEEKPVIAGILQNRLNIGMALQVDATIQYAKGYDKATKKWWTPVTITEYKSVKSPYNTYLYPGLPPGPIANPGIEAINAAANPASTSAFYYIHDSNGKIHTAKTLSEHEANVAKYIY